MRGFLFPKINLNHFIFFKKTKNKSKKKSKQLLLDQLFKLFSFKVVVGLNIFLFICFLLVFGLFLYNKAYAQKIYPGVKLGDLNLGSEDISWATSLISEKIDKYSQENITLVYKDKKWTPSLEDLGFTPYAQQVENQAYCVGRGGEFWNDSYEQIKSLFFGYKIKTNYDLEKDVLDNYLESIASEINQPATSSTLVIEDDTVKTIPGKNGNVLYKEQLKKQIKESIEFLEQSEVNIVLNEVSFDIRPDDIVEARTKSLIMLSKPIVLKYDGKIYTIERDQIAPWIRFYQVEYENSNSEIDPFGLAKRWFLDVQLDEEGIKEYIGNLASEIDIPTLNKRVMDSGGREVVLRNGRDGKKLNIDQVFLGIKERIEKTEPEEREFDLPVEVEKAQVVKVTPSSYGIIPKTNEKYIDVSLSRQILTCFEDGKAQFSTLISSGIPKYSTPSGTFHIYAKSALARMRWVYGPDHPDNYDLLNVPYAMFFSGDFSLHGTYWHSNFGHPMSHGCVNLPTSAAAWVWNWAPKGTKVVVY